MNPKQRYLAAVNRQPTDRPPFDLMGTACGLFDGLLARLKALKGVTSADRAFRKGQNVGRYNDELRAALKAFIKQKAPHVRIFHHTCGNVRLLIPDLIETGIDVLNPVQPVPGMEPARLVREFGRDLCFHGGADTIKLLRGSVEGVRQGARQLCQDFTGGHWIVASANHLQDDIPPENVCALFDSVKELYGK